MNKLEKNWYEIGHASARLMESQGGFGSKLAQLYYASDLSNAKKLFLAFEDLFLQSMVITCSEDQQVEQYKDEVAPIYYVIYSPNEMAITSGAGYWSNEEGWTNEQGCVTFFAEAEKEAFNLPQATGGDAKWVPVELSGAEISVKGLHDEVVDRFVSFGNYQEDSQSGVDSFGSMDEDVLFYTTYKNLMEAKTNGMPLFDDVFIEEIHLIYFQHINVNCNAEIAKEFAKLYQSLEKSDNENAEGALGFVAQAQAAWEGDLASQDLGDLKNPSPSCMEALEGCIEQMLQAQDSLNKPEFNAALLKARQALEIADENGHIRESGDYYAIFRHDPESEFPYITEICEDRDGKYVIDATGHATESERSASANAWGYRIVSPKDSSPQNSSVEVEYWDSTKYNPVMGDETKGSFQMHVIDRRALGNLDVDIAPTGGNLDDNFNVLLEVNRLKDSDDDLPCAHIHIGDCQMLSVFQRNQELVLRLGDDARSFQNSTTALDFKRDGVPQYEQVVLVK